MSTPPRRAQMSGLTHIPAFSPEGQAELQRRAARLAPPSVPGSVGTPDGAGGGGVGSEQLPTADEIHAFREQVQQALPGLAPTVSAAGVQPQPDPAPEPEPEPAAEPQPQPQPQPQPPLAEPEPQPDQVVCQAVKWSDLSAEQLNAVSRLKSAAGYDFKHKKPAWDKLWKHYRSADHKTEDQQGVLGRRAFCRMMGVRAQLGQSESDKRAVNILWRLANAVEGANADVDIALTLDFRRFEMFVIEWERQRQALQPRRSPSPPRKAQIPRARSGGSGGGGSDLGAGSDTGATSGGSSGLADIVGNFGAQLVRQLTALETCSTDDERQVLLDAATDPEAPLIEVMNYEQKSKFVQFLRRLADTHEHGLTDALLRAFDEDGSGQLDEAEFRRMLTSATNDRSLDARLPWVRKMIRPLFHFLDRDRDRGLHWGELRQMLSIRSVKELDRFLKAATSADHHADSDGAAHVSGSDSDEFSSESDAGDASDVGAMHASPPMDEDEVFDWFFLGDDQPLRYSSGATRRLNTAYAAYVAAGGDGSGAPHCVNIEARQGVVTAFYRCDFETMQQCNKATGAKRGMMRRPRPSSRAQSSSGARSTDARERARLSKLRSSRRQDPLRSADDRHEAVVTATSLPSSEPEPEPEPDITIDASLERLERARNLSAANVSVADDDTVLTATAGERLPPSPPPPPPAEGKPVRTSGSMRAQAQPKLSPSSSVHFNDKVSVHPVTGTVASATPDSVVAVPSVQPSTAWVDNAVEPAVDKADATDPLQLQQQQRVHAQHARLQLSGSLTGGELRRWAFLRHHVGTGFSLITWEQVWKRAQSACRDRTERAEWSVSLGLEWEDDDWEQAQRSLAEGYLVLRKTRSRDAITGDVLLGTEGSVLRQVVRRVRITQRRAAGGDHTGLQSGSTSPRASGIRRSSHGSGLSGTSSAAFRAPDAGAVSAEEKVAVLNDSEDIVLSKLFGLNDHGRMGNTCEWPRLLMRGAGGCAFAQRRACVLCSRARIGFGNPSVGDPAT
jgi:hypothetical protein